MKRWLTTCSAAILAGALAGPAVAQSDAAHQQFLFAYKLLQRGEQPLAAQAFDEYLGRFPDDEKAADGMYYRALLHHQAGSDEQAAALLRQAGKPTLVPPYALDLLRGQVLVDLKRYDEALAALERMNLAGLKPAVAASGWYLRGLAYRGAENLPAAARALGEAAALDSPVRVRAAIDLARTQAMLDDPDKAVRTLEAALALDGGQHAAEAARLLGDLQQKQGRYDAAIAAYRRVVTRQQTSPQFGPSVTGILWSQFAAGQHDAVLQSHRQYRDLLMPEYRATADYLAGSAAAALGRHDQAVRWFEAMLGTQNVEPDLREKALYKLAASQYELGQFDAMREAVTRLGRDYPQSDLLVDAAFLIAAGRAEQGNVDEAAAGLGELIDQGPTSPYYGQALLRRAALLERHDRLARAAADYVTYLGQFVTQGREASDTESRVFLRLLDIYQRLGQDEYAQQLAEQWLEQMTLAPAVRQEALYRLALSLMRQQKLDAALATLDKLDATASDHPFAAQSTYYRGLVLTSMGREAEAAGPLQQSAETDALPTALRANALRVLALHHRKAGNDPAAEQALVALEQRIGRDQLRPDELLYLARQRLAAQDPQGAIALASALAQRSDARETPAYAEALLVAGRAHRRLGELDAAIERFQHASAVSPDLAMDARLELARTTMAQSRYAAALEELQGLTSAESSRIAAWALYESAMARRALALERRRQDDPAGETEQRDAARVLLKKLVLLYPLEELLPLPQMAYVQLADLELSADQRDAARGVLEEMLGRFDQGPWATLGKAQLALVRGRLGEAAAQAKQIEASRDRRLAEAKAALLQRVEDQR